MPLSRRSSPSRGALETPCPTPSRSSTLLVTSLQSRNHVAKFLQLFSMVKGKNKLSLILENNSDGYIGNFFLELIWLINFLYP